jgi:uncharacterized membrane protein
MARTFFKGLAVVLPVAILVATVFWLGRGMEALFSGLFKPFLPANVYFPGMGLIIGLVLCYLVGILMNTVIGPRIVTGWHRLVERIPLVKSLYGAVEDILDSFSQDKKKRFNSVVKIKFPSANGWLIGFVTRQDLSDLPTGLNSPDEIAVYLPMSYQIGGYLIFVPKSAVEPLQLSVEDASRLVLTAGMSIHKAP